MPNRVSQFGKGIVEQEHARMFESKCIRATAKESGLKIAGTMQQACRIEKF